MLVFFLGMLACGLLMQAGEWLNMAIERRERVRVARIRGTAVPGWPGGR